jgi:hypothetical protein
VSVLPLAKAEPHNGFEVNGYPHRLRRLRRRQLLWLLVPVGAVLLYFGSTWEPPLVVVTFRNDLGRTAVVGLCTSYPRCRSTHRYYADSVRPYRSIQENASGSDIVNNFIVTDRAGQVLGCAYLKWHGGGPSTQPLVRLSHLGNC